MSEKNPEVSSPCRSECCLNEDDICFGCFRTLEEIRSWSQLSPEEKRRVISLCEQRRQQDQA